MLPMQGAWVQSLVGEVRSHMSHGVAKLKKKKKKKRKEEEEKTRQSIEAVTPGKAADSLEMGKRCDSKV